MDTEKSTLDQNLSITEATREKIESELIQSNRERKELIESLNQATRERDGYHDELVQARRELDRQSNNVVRLAREKEDLTKEKSNLVVQLTGAERDNRTMSEVNITLNICSACIRQALQNLSESRAFEENSSCLTG